MRNLQSLPFGVLVLALILSAISCSQEYEKLWVYEKDEVWNRFSSPSIGPDGSIYLTDGSALVALTPAGDVQWEFPYSDPDLVPTIGPDGTIYNGVSMMGLYAINPDGFPKRLFELKRVLIGSPALGADSTICFMAGSDSLYVLNPDGNFKWSRGFEPFPDQKTPSSPVIGTDGTIYVCATGLYAFDPQGNLKWSYATGYSAGAPLTIGSGGVLYFVEGSFLKALNPDGTLKWRFSVGDAVGTVNHHCSPIVGLDGTVYFQGSEDGKHKYLYAVSEDEAIFEWRYEIKDYSMHPPTIGADGVIYLPCGDILYAINPDGTLKWRYDAGDEVRSPAIADDGTLYLSAGKKLVALQTESYGLASSPWPKFGHDNQNTGRAH